MSFTKINDTELVIEKNYCYCLCNKSTTFIGLKSDKMKINSIYRNVFGCLSAPTLTVIPRENISYLTNNPVYMCIGSYVSKFADVQDFCRTYCCSICAMNSLTVNINNGSTLDLPLSFIKAQSVYEWFDGPNNQEML